MRRNRRIGCLRLGLGRLRRRRSRGASLDFSYEHKNGSSGCALIHKHVVVTAHQLLERLVKGSAGELDRDLLAGRQRSLYVKKSFRCHRPQGFVQRIGFYICAYLVIPGYCDHRRQAYRLQPAGSGLRSALLSHRLSFDGWRPPASIPAIPGWPAGSPEPGCPLLQRLRRPLPCKAKRRCRKPLGFRTAGRIWAFLSP